MSKYDVTIKKVEPIQVASIRDIVPTPAGQGSLWNELGGYLAIQRVHPAEVPPMTLYYDEEYKDRDWDIEVCMPVDVVLHESQRVKVRTLSAVDTMACTIHHGPFSTINEAYQAIGKWIEANGYRICGSVREIYIRPAEQTPGGASQTDPNTVTEIQFPVEKAKVPWILWPFWAIWRLVAMIVGMTGRLVAVILGFLLIVMGVLFSVTLVGLVVGVPLIAIGVLLVIRGLF